MELVIPITSHPKIEKMLAIMNSKSDPKIKKISVLLAVVVILFTSIDTYLYAFHGINIIPVTTPIIIILAVSILMCGLLQRFFYQLLTRNNLFGSNDEENDSATTITDIEESTNDAIEDVTEKQGTGSVYLKNIDVYKELNEQQDKTQKELTMDAVHEYTNICMVKHLSDENLAKLHENIDHLANGREDLYIEIRSNIDNPLTPTALRHYGWNIGERLRVSLLDRAKFIKAVFPYEMRNATIEYLAKNLKDYHSSVIPIDEPATGDYRFKCMLNKDKLQRK